MQATVKASTKSRAALMRAAVRSEMDLGAENCNRTTAAESSSTKLSEPKASSAALRAVAAAYKDAPHSTSIQARVTVCSHTTVLVRRGGAHAAAAGFEGWVAIWTSPDI